MAFTRLFGSWRPSDKKKVPQTLLLADDSVTIQRVIELTFADEDITVVAVSDGDQAIERIEAEPPDIVLVDIGMPGRTGYEVAQHIKQSPRLSHIPVLLLTGAFEPVDQAKAAAAGCDGVLAKPFEPQLVIARVKELLGGSAGSGDLRPRPVAAETTAKAPPAAPAQPDIWGTVPAAAPEGSPRTDTVAQLDTYFAELDQAFSTLAGQTAAPAPRSEAAVPPVHAVTSVPSIQSGPDPQDAPAHDSAHDAAAMFSTNSASVFGGDAAAVSSNEAAPVPVPPPAVGSDASAPLAAPAPTASAASAAAAMEVETPPVQPPVSGAPFAAAPSAAVAHLSATAPLPPLADAFAAILAAEQHEPGPAFASGWPSAPSGHIAQGDEMDEMIEDVTRRVLERLSTDAVRETVAGLVSGIAERLVREEIERIKASVK
jgi:CheY-like chemotaxis protein